MEIYRTHIRHNNRTVYDCDDCKHCVIYNYDNIPLTPDLQITACEFNDRIIDLKFKSGCNKKQHIIIPYWCPIKSSEKNRRNPD